MSFLFKKKGNEKSQSQAPNHIQNSNQPSGLPQASRNIHTSDGNGISGAVKPPLIGAVPEDRKNQSPPPTGGANGSLSSLNEKAAPIAGQVAPFARRDRAGSELGVS